MTNAKIESPGEQNIAQAIAAFQKSLPTVTQDGNNPHFNSKFATLANMSTIVLPKLAEQGLAFSTGSFVENGVMILDAHLMHESGTSRSMQFPIVETNPQKVGSAISYYRRYALASLTGVVADSDDDGNAASNPSPAERHLAQTKERTTTPGSLNDLNAKIRGWIGDATLPPTATDAERKAAEAAVESRKTQVNDRLSALPGTPVEKRAALIKELGIK